MLNSSRKDLEEVMNLMLFADDERPSEELPSLDDEIEKKFESLMGDDELPSREELESERPADLELPSLEDDEFFQDILEDVRRMNVSKSSKKEEYREKPERIRRRCMF